MRIALDTNILAYAEGVNGVERQSETHELIQRLSHASLIVPTQALGELFNVLVRKAGFGRPDARNTVLTWHDAVTVSAPSTNTLIAALDLATDHQLSIWDSIILATASEKRCRFLLSEDMQDGFTWGGVTVANPFAVSRNALLESLLRSGDGIT